MICRKYPLWSLAAWRGLACLLVLLAALGHPPVVVAALGHPPVVVAAEASAITLHLRLCPLDYRGRDFYATCHATPIAGMSFQLDGLMPVTGVTDAAGDVTFATLAAGTYTVRGGPPGDFVRNTIYCSRAKNLAERVAVARSETTAFTVSLAGDDPIICDWYAVGEDRGGPPPPGPTLPPGSPASLTLTLLRCPTLTPNDTCTPQGLHNVAVTPGAPGIALAQTPVVIDGVLQVALAMDASGSLSLTLDDPRAAPDDTGRAFCTTPFGADYRDAALRVRPAFRLQVEATIVPGEHLSCVAILPG